MYIDDLRSLQRAVISLLLMMMDDHHEEEGDLGSMGIDATERNMGQSPYLCSGSAGFCCWGLGKGRPCPHVKAWGGTAQITTQGHRGTFFRIVFRCLAIAALSFSGLFD